MGIEPSNFHTKHLGLTPTLRKHLQKPITFLLCLITDESYTDAELARVSVLILDVTKTAYVSPVAKRLASVMKNFNKKIDRKNLNFVNKTAIYENIHG